MEAYARRTRNIGPQCHETYEFSHLINLDSLGVLFKRYISSYGEELSEERLNRAVLDLITGLLSSYRGTSTHRWLTRNFNEGFEFIELFEKEAGLLLGKFIPNWRDIESEAFHISIPDHLANTFIGVKPMLPNVNVGFLNTVNQDDTFIGNHLHPLFDTQFLLDFSKNMVTDINEVELQALSHCSITWAYLVEECMRISVELSKKGTNPATITESLVVQYLDHEELQTRLNSSKIPDRILLIEDGYSLDRITEKFASNFASIVARVIYGNINLLCQIYEQITLQIRMMNYHGHYTIHCTNFEWFNRVGRVTFTAFKF